MKEEIEKYFDKLWPINRSLTGNGNRESLQILSELADIKIKEIPSGTQCFDWTVPPEWNVKEAWIKDSKGNTIINFSDHNIHLLGYSEPFSSQLTFDELKDHIYTLPEQPDLVPYLTSYYKRRWGFCMAHNEFIGLNKDEVYEVHIDSTFDEDGSMTMGEAVIKGESEKEILFSTYICHPSLASNELSGPLVSAFIYSKLKERKKTKYTYRFAFVPETIGAVCLLSEQGEKFKKDLIAGFVITCIGDNGKFTFKKSRRGNTLADRAAELILEQTESDFNLVDFFPGGSDERQYCSPGFNLPVGSLMRTMYGKYAEYHTSADNRNYISFSAMQESVEKYLAIVDLIEKNDYYINQMPYGEPQLGKRGLYPTLGSQKDTAEAVGAMMWMLNLADGENDLIDISKRTKVEVSKLYPIIDELMDKGLIVRRGAVD